MRLTDKERTVLACVELRADASVKTYRKETGLREHTIRYHLRNLIERGIATPAPFVDMHLLGYTIFNVFFSIGAEKKSTKEALLRTLIASKHVTWVGEFGGEYQYGIALCARELGFVSHFLAALSKRFGNIFFEKAVSCQFGTHTYYHKYLSAKRFSVSPLYCGTSSEHVEIDELDDKILSALATHGGLSHRRLAQEVRVPLSTLELRISKLEERKIIKGYYYMVDAVKFGMQRFKLMVYGKGLDAALKDGLSKYCQSHPAIVHLIECFGSWDFEIGVEAEGSEPVMEVIQEIYEQFGASINTIRLLMKFRDLKTRWYPG